jgi:hypothetical protein
MKGMGLVGPIAKRTGCLLFPGRLRDSSVRARAGVRIKKRRLWHLHVLVHAALSPLALYPSEPQLRRNWATCSPLAPRVRPINPPLWNLFDLHGTATHIVRQLLAIRLPERDETLGGIGLKIGVFGDYGDSSRNGLPYEHPVKRIFVGVAWKAVKR